MRITCFRAPRQCNVSPIYCSALPALYAGAVSIKLMPQSRAALIASILSSSECASHPAPPMPHVPRQISETSSPVLPNFLYRMIFLLQCLIICFLLYHDRHSPFALNKHCLLPLTNAHYIIFASASTFFTVIFLFFLFYAPITGPCQNS